MPKDLKNINISPAVNVLCQHVADVGSVAWLVGGCVRDMLLKQQPKDWDVEIFGLSEESLHETLQRLGKVELVGKQFGVRKLWFEGVEIDVALPRKEKKDGLGHQGFDVVCDPSLSPKQATLRRDFSINAMMFNPVSEKLLDFHQGQQDLENKVLRHVSPAFVEDPLRPLRAMQFAARFNLTLHPETAQLCRNMLGEANTLPPERVWQEWLKWSRSAYPSQGLQALKDMGWDSLYPELVALQGCPQDSYWHPEGDVWIHTRLVVDEACKLANEKGLSKQDGMTLMFAALCHDLGKPITTYTNEEGKIVSPNHGQAGVQPSVAFLERIGATQRLIQHIKPLVKEHVAHFSCDKPTPRAVKRLAKRLLPSHIMMWEMLTEADAGGRYPAPKSRPALAWLKRADELAVTKNIEPPIVTGKLLLSWGMQASPQMGKVLEQAYEAQMDGAFDSEISAERWYKNNIL